MGIQAMSELPLLVHGTNQCIFANTESWRPATWDSITIECLWRPRSELWKCQNAWRSMCVCGNTCAKDNSIFLHCFPSDSDRKQLWIRVFHMQKYGIKPHMCVWSGTEATISVQELCEISGQQAQHTVYLSSSVSSASSKAFAMSLVPAICANVNWCFLSPRDSL